MDKSPKSSDTDETHEDPIRVKSEPTDDTIKNYAENTMNELLGLFGYDDKINSSDTKNLNLDNYADGKETGSDVNSDDPDSEKEDIKRRRRQRLRQKLCGLDVNSLAQQHMNLVTALKRKEQGESGEQADIENGQVDPSLCAWCRKPGNKQFSLEGPDGVRVFCSEVCFTQCRRATFKKTRVCDWCKHVRHTVNYVELSDGDTQLQFCTEKCLNQYKMSIFCKETQEHLQKMADKADEDSSGESDSERAILITPDLWLKSENRNRKEHLSDKKRSHVKEDSRTASPDGKTVSKSKYGSIYDDAAKISSARRFKTEGNVRQRKYPLVRERSPSPKRHEPQATTSSPQQPAAHGSIPPNMLHPALAGMTPWLPAQFMGALAPGMVPYPGFSPLMLQPGMVPQFAAMVQNGNGLSTKDKEPGEKEQKIIGNKEPLNYSQVNRLLSPKSDRSSVSDTSSHDISQTRSPGLMDKRTSSLFPVDFPQLFAGHGFNQTAHQQFQPQPSRTENTGSSNSTPNVPRIPPVTMMVPFPVVVPFPVPVPIPIPLTYQQLKTLFGHDKPTSSTSRDEKVARLVPERVHDEISPRSYSVHSPMSTQSVSDRQNESNDVRAGSRNSCPDLSSSFSLHEKKTTESYKYLKRSRTPEVARSLDLSTSSKRYRYELINGTSDDGAIDLSAHRHNGNSMDDRSSENSMDIRSVSDDKDFLRDEDDNLPEKDSTVPKIHIITHDEESPPLNQAALPLPPTENSYSTRRGLILDAPTVQKKSRSPSPQERRLYVRNVPRDIIEAARRRCMRTRIRTK